MDIKEFDTKIKQIFADNGCEFLEVLHYQSAFGDISNHTVVYIGAGGKTYRVSVLPPVFPKDESQLYNNICDSIEAMFSREEE